MISDPAPVVQALAANLDVLAAVLAHDPRSEAGLTALADLSLIMSVLRRDHPEPGVRSLTSALHSLIEPAQARLAKVGPGPEQWALHIARVTLDPAAERERLLDPDIHRRIANSEHIVLQLGPSWRGEEVAYMSSRLRGTPLPALRAVSMDGSVSALYELTHVVFYATDFGLMHIHGPVGRRISAQCVRFACKLASVAKEWDLMLELLLAARCIRGRWPREPKQWKLRLREEAGATVSRLHDDKQQFMRLYHPMAIAALLLAEMGPIARGGKVA